MENLNTAPTVVPSSSTTINPSTTPPVTPPLKIPLQTPLQTNLSAPAGSFVHLLDDVVTGQPTTSTEESVHNARSSSSTLAEPLLQHSHRVLFPHLFIRTLLCKAVGVLHPPKPLWGRGGLKLDNRPQSTPAVDDAHTDRLLQLLQQYSSDQGTHGALSAHTMMHPHPTCTHSTSGGVAQYHDAS